MGHELPSNSLVRVVDTRTAPPTATLSNAAIFHRNDARIGFPLQSFDFLSRLASYSAPYFENDQCSCISPLVLAFRRLLVIPTPMAIPNPKMDTCHSMENTDDDDCC